METLDNRLSRRMHFSLYALLLLTSLLGLSVLLEGCTDSCETRQELVYFEPVYLTLDELRASVAVVSPQPVEAVGKIYIRGNLLFVNDPGKGVHIINNTNPSAPIPVGFIRIPGTTDLAVTGNILFADSYVDLVALDISNINDIREVHRITNVFTSNNTLGIQLDANNGLITDWIQHSEVKVYESDCDGNIQPWGGMYYLDGIAMPASFSSYKAAATAPGTGSGPGVGGSMARFTINDSHLYTLDGMDVQTFDISSPTSPQGKGRTPVSWEMETIFPYRDHLFIGSRTGMHILDIANPASPVHISTYEHVRVCDPVVVQDTLAFVTLRSGTECMGFTNQLEVINIADVTQPQLLYTYPMYNPHGLGIDGTTLFICDGQDGLKVYDASDISAIDDNRLLHRPGIQAYDVIPFNNVLIMIGEDGLFQYDYSDPQNIQLLSTIPIVHEGT